VEQSPQAINDYYARKMRLSWFNTAISKLIFKQVLLERAYSKEEFMAFIAKTGFSKYEILDDPANMGFEMRGNLMTILSITITTIYGTLMLLNGLKTKRKWVVIASTPLILVALSQIIILFLMAPH